MKADKNKSNELIFIVIAIIFSVVVLVLLRDFFNLSVNNFTVEVLAAVFGSIVVVASMVIMIRLQSNIDKEREFSVSLFERKLQIYEKLLSTLFKADDDNVISKAEIQDIENQVGVACLVANRALVSIFSQFVYQLKVYGVLYVRSMNQSQKDNFITFTNEELKKDEDNSTLALNKYSLKKDAKDNIRGFFVSLDDLIQGIRDDLAVVEGSIKHDIEDFIKIKYDQFQQMENPNIIDK